MSFFADLGLLWRGVRAGFVPPPFYRPADYPEPFVFPQVIVKEIAPPSKVTPPRQARETSVAELKRDVLDNLKAYQTYIGRLRKADPEAYGMYKRVGAFILPPDMKSHRFELEPGVLARMPTFGAVGLGLASDSSKTDYVPVRFMTMMKVTKPGAYVERRNDDGVIYRCGLFWDDADDKKMKERGTGVFREYMIHVSHAGAVTPLRIKKSEQQVIRHRRGEGQKGGSTSTVSHQRWGLPDIGEESQYTVSDKIRQTFCLMMNFWVQAATQSMIRVTASKGAIVMPFVVDVLDTPSFFADRSATIDVAGHKKRIFHVVRPHIRANGRAVKMHFRGLRTFTWNGYAINITVPGKLASDIADLTEAGVYEEMDDDTPPGFVEIDEFADLVADAVN